MADPIRLLCPRCRTAYRLKVGVRPGATVECSKCGAGMAVPEPAAAPPIAGKSEFAGSSDDRQVTLTRPPEGFKPSGGYSDSSPAEEGVLRGAPTLPLPAAADRSDRSDGSDRSAPTESSPALAEENLETALLDARPGSGRYIEQAVLGRGGMGEVALCIDRNTRRQVALKRILPDTAGDPARRARFVEEAQVTAQLEHPNIVPVHELDRTPDGTIYFTMKLVKGRSLAEIIRDMEQAESGRPPSEKGGFVAARPYAPRGDDQSDAPRPQLFLLSDLLQIFLKVCDGVAFAHSRGVIHRDLKPVNIMVGEYGEVLVMDWGLAKLVGAARPPAGFESRGRLPEKYPPAGEETRGRKDGEASAPVRTDRQDDGLSPTLDGSTVGTPAYMSPEQANGELDKIDARSDIYSLGAILYEILTLERAVEGETPMMVLVNASRNRIVPIETRAAASRVPRELSAIAMKCLAKSRAARYRSVLDLRRDIALFLEGRSVSARPDSMAQSIVKLVKRNKPVSAAVATAAVIIITLTAGFIINLRAERDRARASERQAVAERRIAQKARDDQRATALSASEGFAQAAIRAADEGRFADADFRASAALQVMPDGPWGHYALGAVAYEKRDFAAARHHLEEATRLDPAHEPSRVFLARVQAASGDLAKWERVVADAGTSKDWRGLAAAGEALYAAGKYGESYDALQKAAALLDRQPEVPETTKAQVKDEAERSLACVKTEGFRESLRGLPAEERCKRIEATLVQIFGSVEIHVAPLEAEGIEVTLYHAAGKIRWLDPIRGLPIEKLNANYTGIRDLAPLKGMPLTFLGCQMTQVSDLRPLKGMPLKELDCRGTQVGDLTPLMGMTLKRLTCGNSLVSDLAPLRGMPLTVLECDGANISDLSPLRGMPIEVLRAGNTRPGIPLVDLSPLKGMRLRSLDISTSHVDDLSALKGMPLSNLIMEGTGVTDLTPLEGMNLEALSFSPQRITKGLDVVRTMKSLGRLARWGGGPWLKPEEFWRKVDAGEFNQ